MNYYYILPDGRKVNNMKEVKLILGITGHQFRGMLKGGEIIKVSINQGAHSHDKVYLQTNK